MTQLLPMKSALNETHGAAIDAVNRWRGHCVERYARLEHEVTATLSEMADIPGETRSIPHNFGEKVKRLRAAISADGPFQNSKIAKALDGFGDHLSRRNLLVHATGTVWIDTSGAWLWRFQFQPSGKGRAMEIGCFEKSEALATERALARSSQSLVDQLRVLRRTLRSRHEANS